MLLFIIRAVFVLVVAGLGVRLARATGDSYNWGLLFGGVLISAFAVLVVDIFTPRKRIQNDLGCLLRLDRRLDPQRADPERHRALADHPQA